MSCTASRMACNQRERRRERDLARPESARRRGRSRAPRPASRASRSSSSCRQYKADAPLVSLDFRPNPMQIRRSRAALLGQRLPACQKAADPADVVAAAMLPCGHCGNPALPPKASPQQTRPPCVRGLYCKRTANAQVLPQIHESSFGVGRRPGLLGADRPGLRRGRHRQTGGFGGVAGGDRVATVGDERIDTSQLSQAATNALENVKQEDPAMSMKAFLAAAGSTGARRDDRPRRACASSAGRTASSPATG